MEFSIVIDNTRAAAYGCFGHCDSSRRGNRRRGGGFSGVYFCDRTSGSAGSDLDVPERCGEGHALK